MNLPTYENAGLNVKKYWIFLMIAVLVIAPFSATMSKTDERQLSFYHTHTSESLTVTYFRDGDYVEPALAELNHFLRDFRTGDAVTMDPAVFDILHEIQSESGSSGTYQIISAYRSPATNESLRGKSSGVAKNSQHLLGKAIDVRLTDLDTAELRDVALSLKRGGVGYYKASDFVHVDTGRVRQW
jgi:uncharacterized protein YcbK (DUF882 family)